jgi:hypothetical protein
MLLTAGLLLLFTHSAIAEDSIVNPRAQRFSENPIIRPDMLPGSDGRNINGPSLIRVPEWIVNPLGKYYLYFADHGGQYIRMAYADKLGGPWKVHEPGVLNLKDAPDGRAHIASPDVLIDGERKELRMYFHCPSKTSPHQTTYLARSSDGVRFTANGVRLGPSYFRVFRYGDYWYAIAKPGRLYRSRDGVSGFEEGPNPFLGIPELNASGVQIRHLAVDLNGDLLTTYFTCIGDKPERIMRSSINMETDWTKWTATRPELVLKPEMDYEGMQVPLAESSGGRSKTRENALRDPCIFKEDGKTYLLYSVSGEYGIGIAELLSGK